MRKILTTLIALLAFGLAQTDTQPIIVSALEYVPAVSFPTMAVLYKAEACDKAVSVVFSPVASENGLAPVEHRCYGLKIEAGYDYPMLLRMISTRLQIEGYSLAIERPGAMLYQIWRKPGQPGGLGLIWTPGKGGSSGVIAVKLRDK